MQSGTACLQPAPSLLQPIRAEASSASPSVNLSQHTHRETPSHTQLSVWLNKSVRHLWFPMNKATLSDSIPRGKVWGKWRIVSNSYPQRDPGQSGLWMGWQESDQHYTAFLQHILRTHEECLLPPQVTFHYCKKTKKCAVISSLMNSKLMAEQSYLN